MSRIEEVKKLNYLWHIVGMQLNEEMSNPKYSSINELSLVEMSILQIIEQKTNIIYKEICKTLGLPKSTLTSAANRLEQKGLVKRTPSQNDKRACYLELTEKGAQAQREHIMIEYAVLDKLLSGLNKSEATKFISLLSKALKEE